LSGPGWLQSAITLGGGSLGGALYLGMLAGTGMLWLQLVAIVVGVIMLSAISYVTLSTGKRPYAAINEYVNPVLGVGWITATILANMIWILPQFSLCFDALETCLLSYEESQTSKVVVSIVIGVTAFAIVAMSFRPGRMSKAFDIILKLMVAFVVLCFVAVVVALAANGSINWGEIILGFVPNPTHWSNPSAEIQMLTAGLTPDISGFWTDKIIANQQKSMISVTATAVGLNMTFLLPYSMLARSWDKPFRGLARFDLVTAMAIPFVVVTSCIVIAAAHAFHAKADDKFLASDPAVIQTSPLFGGAEAVLEKRFGKEHPADKSISKLKPDERTKFLAEYASSLSKNERKLAATLVKPSSQQLAATLAPLFGPRASNLVFGLGTLAMAFSTIVILMLINGYAVAEVVTRFDDPVWRLIGGLAAGVVGVFWWTIWTGDSKTWLVVVASTFGAILLPIAYVSFFLLMNSKKLLGDEKPTGSKMWIWNILMAVGVAGAVAQAVLAVIGKVNEPGTGSFVIVGLVTFCILAIIGFSARFRKSGSDSN